MKMRADYSTARGNSFLLTVTAKHLVRLKNCRLAPWDEGAGGTRICQRQWSQFLRRTKCFTATANQSRTTHQGFTLIEILIVMVIISVVAGMTLLTISGNQNKQLEYATNKLVNLMTLAEQEAMLQPATLGVGFTNTGFQFYSYKILSKWQPQTDKYLGEHHLPANVQMTVKVHNKVVPLNGKPQIIISESGDLTPFTIFIAKKGSTPRYKIIGNADGKITSEMIQ